MTQSEQAGQFASVLFGDERLEGLYVTTWTLPDRKTRWRRAGEPGAIASLVTELDRTHQAVYIATTLTDTDPTDSPRAEGEPDPSYTRPHADQSAGLVALWAEIDIAGEGHKGERLPRDEAEAQKIIDAMRLEPTMIVRSGGGIHLWWVLHEPWLVRDAVDPDAERRAMADLERDWVLTARYHADRLGRWKVDAVHDLARLLRPAGTTNRKRAGELRRVEIIHFNEGAKYDPDDFTDAMPDESVMSAYRSERFGFGSLQVKDAEAALMADVDLSALWARVNSDLYKATEFVPPWLADILEIEDSDMPEHDRKVAQTWNGHRRDLKDDPSSYDQALASLLVSRFDVDTEGVIEALMCRRLRSGNGADKVNPHKRLDYLARTVARARLSSEARKVAEKRTDDAIATMAAERVQPAEPSPEPEPDGPGGGESAPKELDSVPRKVSPGYSVGSERMESPPLGSMEAVHPHDYDMLTEELIDRPQEVARKDATVRVLVDSGIPVDQARARAEAGPKEAPADDRHGVEAAQLDLLTEMLIPQVYTARGVRVWRLEYADYGANQRVRMLIKLPVDFDWPVGRPSRYRPGHLLPTEWWPRNTFDTPKGFRSALERDCMIASRVDNKKDDGDKAEWGALIRSLVPLWRQDSSGISIAAHAHEWLYGYLLERTATSLITEAIASGIPWMKDDRGWSLTTPPIIYLDRSLLVAHCAKEAAGRELGRLIRGVTDHMSLTQRRPRPVNGAPRKVWHEINSDEFIADEWLTIMEMVRPKVEQSRTGRALRSVPPTTPSGVAIDDLGQEEREEEGAG